MPNNKKYHKSSLYYPDDKDLYDFMQSSGAVATKLKSFLLGRGIYLTRNASPDAIHKYISVLPLAWADLVELVDIVDLAEKKEKSAFMDYSFGGDETLISEALLKVSEARSLKKKENYNIFRRDGKIVAEIDYIDIDTSKTPMLQGKPATLTLEFTKEQDYLRVTHTSNETAKKILEAFQGFLEEIHVTPEGVKIPVESSIISLKDILDPELRVMFFTLLSRNVEHLIYDNTTNVKVARIPKEDCSKLDSSDSEEDEIDTEEEQKIKNVIIQGVNIETTAQYKEFLALGFCISSISWESIDNQSKDKVSFIAGFEKPDEATGLEYKILHRRIYSSGKYQPKEKVLPMYIIKYKDAIQKAAIAALTEVREKALERSTEPAEADLQ